MSRKHPARRPTEAELDRVRRSWIGPILLEWGQVEATRGVILRQGQRRFGPPTESVRAVILDEWDLHRLERLIDNLLDAASWQDLLATP